MPGVLTKPLIGTITGADEVFAVTCEFASIEKLGETKNGRLGRLTYNFKMADALNQNRRIYPMSIVSQALEAFAKRVAKNVVFGRVDHPGSYDEESYYVTLADAAIKIASATIDDDGVITVVADVLDNEYGRQLASTMAVGGNPGISQRALALWREADDEERQRFKIPDDEYAIVAEMLRLITYDIVSEPGFADADGAKITEHKTGVTDMKTLDELKTAHPAVFALAIAEGKTLGIAEAKIAHEAALAQATTAAAAEAVKPLNEQVAKLQAANKAAIEALGALKPAMVAMGLVNEQITDREAAAQVATLKAANEQLVAERAAAQAVAAEATKVAAEATKLVNARKAMEAVSTKYREHKAHDMLLTRLADRGFADEAAALEAAQKEIAFIEMVNPGLKAGSTMPPTAPSILDGLLKSNSASPLGDNSNESKGGNALALAALNGMSL